MRFLKILEFSIMHQYITFKRKNKQKKNQQCKNQKHKIP
jgi:hypothetical protein